MSTLRRSSRKSTKFSNNTSTNSDAMLFSKQSSASALFASESNSNNHQNSDNNYAINTTENQNVKPKVAIQSSTSSDSSGHSNTQTDFASSSSVTRKRKAKQQRRKVKKLKIHASLTNNSTENSSNIYESDTDDDHSIELRTSKTSPVWRYAKRHGNKNFSECVLCGKHISTNNWSTTTHLRRHLIEKYDKTDLTLPSASKTNQTTILKNIQRNLHRLAMEAAIRDGLPFNAFQRPGLSKFIEEASQGRSSYSF